MKKYTVILLYPDYANEDGNETYLAHVKANTPLDAICVAQREAVGPNVEMITDPDDFAVLHVFAGHQKSI